MCVPQLARRDELRRPIINCHQHGGVGVARSVGRRPGRHADDHVDRAAVGGARDRSDHDRDLVVPPDAARQGTARAAGSDGGAQVAPSRPGAGSGAGSTRFDRATPSRCNRVPLRPTSTRRSSTSARRRRASTTCMTMFTPMAIRRVASTSRSTLLPKSTSRQRRPPKPDVNGAPARGQAGAARCLAHAGVADADRHRTADGSARQ